MNETYTPQDFVNMVNEISESSDIKLINFSSVEELKELAIKFGYVYNESGNIFIKKFN